MIFNLSNINEKPPSFSSLPFLIDANILYYFHVKRNYNSDEQKKITAFSNYISDLRERGNDVAVSSFNLQEVLHAIEKLEYETYCSQCEVINKKKYRKISAERVNVKKKLESVYKQISSTYRPIDDVLPISHIESFVSEFDKHIYDPMDYFSISTRKSESFYYITNDSDFKYDPFFKNSSDIHLITY